MFDEIPISTIKLPQGRFETFPDNENTEIPWYAESLKLKASVHLFKQPFYFAAIFKIIFLSMQPFLRLNIRLDFICMWLV